MNTQRTHDARAAVYAIATICDPPATNRVRVAQAQQTPVCSAVASMAGLYGQGWPPIKAERPLAIIVFAVEDRRPGDARLAYYIFCTFSTGELGPRRSPATEEH